MEKLLVVVVSNPRQRASGLDSIYFGLFRFGNQQEMPQDAGLGSDFLTWPETEMALFECGPSTGSVCGRVPTRLRRVARWRQRIAAKHTPGRVPEANGEAIRMGDAS
jgi:hypothetical protein